MKDKINKVICWGILILSIVLFIVFLTIDISETLIGGAGFGLFSIFNFFILILIFYILSNLTQITGDNNYENYDKKEISLVIFLVILCTTCLNAFLISDMSNVLSYTDADITWIVGDMLVLIIEMVFVIGIATSKIVLWFPITMFSSLYVMLFGFGASGLDGVGAFLVLLFVLLFIGGAEFGISIWLNFRKLKADIKNISNSDYY